MHSLFWIIAVAGVLTLIGSAVLVFITVRYYWGDRGTRPLTGEARRLQKEEELRLRAKQIEYSEKHPRQDRSPDFLDNRKQ